MNKNGFLIIMVFLFGIFNAQETISELELEYQNLKYIHKKGKNRWDFYKQLSKTHFRE